MKVCGKIVFQMSQLWDFIVFLEDSENYILQPIFASFVNYFKNTVKILGHVNNKSITFIQTKTNLSEMQ